MPIRPLSPELAEKAKKELNEDPARIEADLANIKDWIAKQPHLRVRTDDQWLVSFLRGCKFSLERTKEKIDLYYSMRSLAPEMFTPKYTDPKFRDILEQGFQVLLPSTVSPTSPRVVLIRPGQYDPDRYKISEVMSVSFVKQQLTQLECDQLVVCGAETILDLEGVTMAHFTQMTPTIMKKMTVLGQDATPIRMKGVHYLNTPPGFETIFNFMKGLLNEKNRNRLHVHNKNYEALYKFIPKDILPAEYGGKGPTIIEILEKEKQKVDEHKEWLAEDLQYGSDESKRPGKPKSSEEMFGAEGSFRQLQFD